MSSSLSRAIEIKYLLIELSRELKHGAYELSPRAFDLLADTIRNEEKDLFYRKHPDEAA